MSIRNRIVAGAAAVAVSLTVGTADVAAQVNPAPGGQQAPGQPQLPDSVQEMIQEFQELQSQLTSLQEQAIEQSDELQDQRDELQSTVEEAMQDVNPSVDEDIERMEELQSEMAEAQEAQDQERMMELSSEAGQLRTELQSAQAEAMERPAVQEEIESFQNSLMEEMTTIEPETEELIARLDTLTERFRRFQQSQGAPQGQPQAPGGPGGR